MMLKKIIFLISNPKITRLLLSFYWTGYMQEIGWFNSFQLQMPVGRNNEPLPWVTYSFISFIGDRLNKALTIAEYGSGNSTIFYSKTVKKVFAVEHEKEWFDKISKNIPANVEISFIPLDINGNYSKFASTLKEQIDIIIVDGRDRVNCMINSIGSLSEKGVLVLDDSEREEYRNGLEYLQKSGFKRIDFWGMAPGIFFNKCTSVFYREKNCLNI